MKRSIPLIAILLSIFILSCNKPDPDSIALIDGQQYDRDAIYQVYNPEYFNSLDKDKKEEKLKEWAYKTAAMKEIQNFDSSDKDPYLTALRSWENKTLMNDLFRKVIIERSIGRDYLRDLYEKSGMQIKTRHILVSGRNPDAHNIIRTLKNTLTVDNFPAMAARYSDDRESSAKGGNLGFINPAEMMPPFDSVMVNTPPGQLSAAFKTEYGTHFIITEEIKKTEKPPFEEAKAELLSMASNRFQEKIRKNAAHYLDSLKNANDLHIYSKNCQLLSDTLLTLRLQQKKALGADRIIDFLRDLENPLPMALINDSESIYQNWLILYLQPFGDRDPGFKSPFQIEKFIRDNFQTHLLVREAEQYGLDREDKYLIEKERYSYSAALEAFKAHVTEGITAGEKEIEAWYEQKKDDLYLNEERVQVQEVLLSDSLLALSIYEKLLNGEDFDSVATAFTERRYSKDKNGILPFFKRGRYGEMGKAAFDLKTGELAGPFEIRDKWSVIKLLERREASYKPLEEVRDKIERSVIRNKEAEEIQASLKELLKKYKVKLNEKAL